MKKICIALIILGVLIAGWFFIQQSTQQQRSQSSVPSSLWNSFSWDTASAITIGTASLQKKDDSWRVEKDATWYPVRHNSIDQIESFFTDLRIKQRIAETAQKHTELEISDALGINVRIADSQNNTLSEFIIGKSGLDYASCYLRLKNKNSVYLVSPNCRFTFDQIDWRDLRIAPDIEASDIEKITITQNTRSRELSKQEDKLEWKENDTDLDAEKIRDILVSIIETDATDIIPSNNPSITPAFDSPFAQMILNKKDTTPIIITISAKVSDKEEYYVQGTNKEFTYTVPASRMEQQWLTPQEKLQKLP